MNIEKLQNIAQQAELFKDDVACRLFFYLLLFANYKDTNDLKQGQIHTSLSKLASHLGCTKRRIETALKKLQMLHLVRQETLHDVQQKGSIITIIKDYVVD